MCLVSQTPFDHLNERHAAGLGVLLIDAHPDVTMSKIYMNMMDKFSFMK